jgi:hypothetical protein
MMQSAPKWTGCGLRGIGFALTDLSVFRACWYWCTHVARLVVGLNSVNPTCCLGQDLGDAAQRHDMLQVTHLDTQYYPVLKVPTAVAHMVLHVEGIQRQAIEQGKLHSEGSHLVFWHQGRPVTKIQAPYEV